MQNWLVDYLLANAEDPVVAVAGTPTSTIKITQANLDILQTNLLSSIPIHNHADE